MSWKEKISEWGGGDLTFLSEDGEAITFVVVGEPVLLEGKYKGKPSQKIGCPIVTVDGFALLIAGKRLARKLSKYEEQFGNTAFIAIRHGEQGDINATYELKTLVDVDLTKQLFDLTVGKDYSGEATDAVRAAIEVMRQ